MLPSPHVAGALVALAAAAMAVHLALAPAPFAPSAAIVISIGVVLLSIVTAVGLILVRGRWARRLGMVVATAALGVAAVAEDFRIWAAVTVVLALAALATLTGRWLDGWIRGRPSATGPDPNAVLLLLGLIGLVPIVGLVAPSGLETAHGVLGAAGVFLAWAYGKAQVWALWATRLVLPLLATATALASPWPGAIALGAYAGGITWLAWTSEARLAVQPLLEELPGPRQIRKKGAGRS